MIKYVYDLEEKDFPKICDLYKSAGWWDEGESCTPQKISKLILGSFCFISVWEDDKLVGMGRAISDGSDDAYLQDIFVDVNYRKQGMATNIISRLTDYCLSKNIDWVALIAAPGSVGLYEKAGFQKMIDYTPMHYHQT
ncbi:MAG: hypothetical protein A2X86_02840 [Bdellovibrionales bacterium GWA2_49_15]|nr:MAG: hypothetical protein A2X86_02840 [Bdellovibrionales bacterium GWA2_49_15]HAZ14124.1 N-acetyltransferase [Bdellovibrionales bacterium]